MSTETTTKPWRILEEDKPTNSDSLALALGISDERRKEINSFMGSFASNDTPTSLSDTIRRIGDYAQNPEEYAMMVLALGRSIG